MSGHSFDPVWEGCTRCGALPGEAVECEPPKPFRRFGEYVSSACDAWNRDEPLEEDE